MNALQDLSVIYAITPDPFWRKAARVSSRSLGRFTPPGEVKIVEYQGGRRRGGAYSRKYPPYTQGARSWTLALDADLVVTEDLTELFERVRASGCRVAIRESKLTSRPSFKPDAYRGLFGRAGLPFRQIGQTCAFFIETELAKALMPTVSRWRLWVDQTRVKLHKHYHNAQAAFALGLAALGVGNEQTLWLNQPDVSWWDEPPGVIHHFGRDQWRAVRRRMGFDRLRDFRRSDGAESVRAIHEVLGG